MKFIPESRRANSIWYLRFDLYSTKLNGHKLFLYNVIQYNCIKYVDSHLYEKKRKITK
jgi:hypothetical protein